MPGPANFNTPMRIITLAMRHAGKLGQDAQPSSSQYAEKLGQLNDLINVEQTQGIKLWLQDEISITAPTLVAGTALYRLGPTGNVVMTKPTRIILGRFQDLNNNKWPIEPPMSREEYNRLSNTVQQGAITSYYVDKQQLTLDVYLWQTPDAVAAQGTVILTAQTQVTQMISLTDAMSFPLEWFMYLQWGLADQICTGQPQAIVTRCANMSEKYRKQLEDWDVEDASSRFVPDQRYFTGRQFR